MEWTDIIFFAYMFLVAWKLDAIKDAIKDINKKKDNPK